VCVWTRPSLWVCGGLFHFDLHRSP